jgi:thiol-disulfide isomerase/thioredoxin
LCNPKCSTGTNYFLLFLNAFLSFLVLSYSLPTVLLACLLSFHFMCGAGWLAGCPFLISVIDALYEEWDDIGLWSLQYFKMDPDLFDEYEGATHAEFCFEVGVFSHSLLVLPVNRSVENVLD